VSVLAAAIGAALSRCEHCSLDSDEDRAEVAARVESALLDSPDAALIRAFFASAPTDGTRLIAMAASTGAVQSRIIEAAARLAGVTP